MSDGAEPEAIPAAGPWPTSPVPSDAHLWPGEQPFTAFGQFGEGSMDNRVFDQDMYWVNIKGEPFLLQDMSEGYRGNVIAFLHVHVAYYHAHAAMREAVDSALSVAAGLPSGTLLARDLGIPIIAEMDPVEWLESTPLMRKLRALTPASC